MLHSSCLTVSSLGFVDNHHELTELLNDLPQETRIAKLLVSLKGRLAPYMAGEEDAFREVQVGMA